MPPPQHSNKIPIHEKKNQHAHSNKFDNLITFHNDERIYKRMNHKFIFLMKKKLKN